MRLLALLMTVALAACTLPACGGGPKPMDKESIRDNADKADRDIDRESDRNKEDDF